MPQNIDLEIKVIKKFIDKTKQDRYVQFVSSHKTRHKFISDLSHLESLRLDKFDKVNGNELDIIMSTIQKRKLLDTNCYIISENRNIDTKTLDAKSAISETVGYGMGTFLVFGDADIVYYECETINTRYINKDS
jgi:hypothetical protein